MTTNQIIQFAWEDEKSQRFDIFTDGKPEQRRVVIGEPFSIELLEGPHCAGYERGGIFYPCPHKAKGIRKCEDCKQKEGLSIAQFCDGYNLDLFSPQDIDRLNAPHYLYFAFFDANTYKVGVSLVSRGYLRQVEQGSHFAAVLAEGMGGVLARQVETFFRRCGIIDKFTSHQKKEILFPDFSVDDVRKKVDELMEKYLESLLFEKPEIKRYLKSPFEIIDFSSFYNLEEGRSCPKQLHSLILQKGEAVSGKLLSVKGQNILIETDREKILLNAKDLAGWNADLTERSPGVTTKDAFQSALF